MTDAGGTALALAPRRTDHGPAPAPPSRGSTLGLRVGQLEPPEPVLPRHEVEGPLARLDRHLRGEHLLAKAPVLVQLPLRVQTLRGLAPRERRQLRDGRHRLQPGDHHRPARPPTGGRTLGSLWPALGARRRVGRLLGLLCLLGRDQACLEELVAKVLHGAGWLLSTPQVSDESPVLGFARSVLHSPRLLTAGLVLLAACSNPVDRAAKERIFSPEDPPPVVASAKEALDPQKLASDPKLARRVLDMGPAEVTERLGPHRFSAEVSFTWTAGKDNVKLSENRLLESATGGVAGDFHARLDNSRDQGLEVVRSRGQVFARSKYGKYRLRLRDRGMAERTRDETAGALRELDGLFQGRLELALYRITGWFGSSLSLGRLPGKCRPRSAPTPRIPTTEPSRKRPSR